MVTSGLGLAPRRREIGILKAVGWQTDEIMLRSIVECAMLSLAAASISILLAFGWLKALNGVWIASIFLSGVSVVPAIEVPYDFAPVAAMLAYGVALVLALAGTLFASWRAATATPIEAMR
jgi:ABC-type lipoprotein release transport system permease subunit